MRLKMLIGMSGPGFTVDPGDVTEHFSKKEANRLIRAGYAEEAPPVERKKPETKQEWDEERATLLAENEQLKADALAFSERETALLSQVETLTSFKDSVTAAVHVIHPPVETTVTKDDRETRG
jgi:F-type H+-transporting ATPase subunit b